MQQSEEKLPRLITMSISHYCEKARWALERWKIPYIEECHVSLIHRLATSRVGGKSVPVLVTEEGTFTDSSDILHYVERTTTATSKLYPKDTQLRREVEKIVDLFDSLLGPCTRVWFYYYLLDDRDLMVKLFCQGVEAIEQELFPILFPSIKEAMRRGLNVTAESADKSYEKINSIFEIVNGMLADRRSFLVGDSFSAADLTFACLSAPVLLPAEYSVKLPQLDEMPEEMAKAIKLFRETSAGNYALRLFREERFRGG